MAKYFEYEVEIDCSDIDETYDTSISIKIEDDLKTIISYLYEKHFNIHYRDLGWWLEPGAKEFVKDIENKWLKNKLDTDSIIRDSDFRKHYINRNCEGLIEIIEDHIADEIESDLMCKSDAYLKRLDDECYGSIWVECTIPELDYYGGFNLDIPDYDPDVEDEDDDDF